MFVCFDTQIFGTQQFGGISRYITSLASEMSSIDNVHPYVVAPMHINYYLDGLPRKLVFGRRVTRSRVLPLTRRAVSTLASEFVLRMHDPDIIHKSYYHLLPIGSERARKVLTVHDLIQEKFPQYFPRGNIMAKIKKLAIARADHIVCVSESTRNDLLATYAVAEDKVSVTLLGHHALDRLTTITDGASFRKAVFGCDLPYLLYVGQRSRYKNFSALLEAYAHSPWLRENFMLLCFGGGDFTKDELNRHAALKVLDRVRHLGGGDSTLADCYRHAAVFVLPSLYEGFGIPVLEAMSLSCPVACSNVSSMPEVAGGAAVLFLPQPESIQDALEKLLGSPIERSLFVSRGKARAEQFSWQRCAQETVRVYRQILTV